MAMIQKKILRKYFEEIQNGSKTFEVRLADFDIHEGDTLVLREWNDTTSSYTGRYLTVPVAYVFKTKDLEFWKKEEIVDLGLLVIGIGPSQKV